MKDLRQRMEMDMDLRGFLPQTKKTYWYHVELPRFGGVFRAWASSPCLMLFFICHR